MKTKIIAAFPGTGKSYFASSPDHSISVTDLDSHSYTSGYGDDGKVRNPDFPNNYLADIKKTIGSIDLLLVSCQPEVIAALRKLGLKFTLVYPERVLRDEYVRRFEVRGSSQFFTNQLSNSWDHFLDFLEGQADCEKIQLGSGQYISDVSSNFIH
jgi:hypothetical protein